METKFEDLIKELEQIVRELESNTLDLETSIEKYKRGLELSKMCHDFLEEASKVVVKNETR